MNTDKKCGRLARIVAQKERLLNQMDLSFFSQRGHLALARDQSAHRRYTYLYEDLQA